MYLLIVVMSLLIILIVMVIGVLIFIMVEIIKKERIMMAHMNGRFLLNLKVNMPLK